MLLEWMLWPVLAAVGENSAPTREAASPALALIVIACVLAGMLLVLWANERRHARRLPEQEPPAEPATVKAASASKPAAKRASTAGPKLPAGKIVYQDVDGLGTPLFAKKYPLSGKPDYVVLSPDGAPIPIELKLSTDAQEPQRSHIMQLAAYFVILEDLYETPPKYGLLCYASREFTIQNTASLRQKVLRRLVEMARCDEDHPPALSRQEVSKCRVCPFQPICPIGKRQR